jgi:hypothetical protein
VKFRQNSKVSRKQIFCANLPKFNVLVVYSQNGPFLSHVADYFCLFCNNLNEKQAFVIGGGDFRHFRIFSQQAICAEMQQDFRKNAKMNYFWKTTQNLSEF